MVLCYNTTYLFYHRFVGHDTLVRYCANIATLYRPAGGVTAGQGVRPTCLKSSGLSGRSLGEVRSGVLPAHLEIVRVVRPSVAGRGTIMPKSCTRHYPSRDGSLTSSHSRTHARHGSPSTFLQGTHRSSVVSGAQVTEQEILQEESWACGRQGQGRLAYRRAESITVSVM